MDLCSCTCPYNGGTFVTSVLERLHGIAKRHFPPLALRQNLPGPGAPGATEPTLRCTDTSGAQARNLPGRIRRTPA